MLRRSLSPSMEHWPNDLFFHRVSHSLAHSSHNAIPVSSWLLAIRSLHCPLGEETWTID
jgi:hypothetical protein